MLVLFPQGLPQGGITMEWPLSGNGFDLSFVLLVKTVSNFEPRVHL
jgi:hypothetical protein